MPAVRLPSVRLRGKQWTANLRAFGGHEWHPLGLDASASPVEVGAALQRKLDELRLCAQLGAPCLPGLEEQGLLVSDLVGRYLDGRDFDTEGGASYVAGLCRRLKKDFASLTVENLSGPAGEAVIRKWRDRLWAEGLSNKTCNNLLHQLAAILRWGRSGGRRLTGDLPDMPSAVRRGQNLSVPVFEFWTEADFRVLRDKCFVAPEQRRGLSRWCGGDSDRIADYVARRKLYLSLAFYTGAHTGDLDRWRGEWMSVAMGRYERHNAKSARCVSPCWFDMPEQLLLDCRAEVERLGREWRPGELVAGGPWRGVSEVMARATRRIFPDGSRPVFTMRLARRSTVREYTLRGWRTHEVSAILGHVDNTMVQEIYRRVSELGLVSPVRVPWTIASGPRGEPTRTGKLIPFRTA
jgi:hypothetical protein